MADIVPTLYVPPCYSDVSFHYSNCMQATDKYISSSFCRYMSSNWKLLFVRLYVPSKRVVCLHRTKMGCGLYSTSINSSLFWRQEIGKSVNKISVWNHPPRHEGGYTAKVTGAQPDPPPLWGTTPQPRENQRKQYGTEPVLNNPRTSKNAEE